MERASTIYLYTSTLAMQEKENVMTAMPSLGTRMIHTRKHAPGKTIP
jgi:hypothetical protein